MLNRTDRDYEKQAQATPIGHETCVASREMTVGELLEQHIYKAERTLKALHDLKGSLPQNFLSSGASRIDALLKL